MVLNDWYTLVIRFSDKIVYHSKFTAANILNITNTATANL